MRAPRRVDRAVSPVYRCPRPPPRAPRTRMPAPRLPESPLEIELDSADLIAEPEERTMSHTRRLGTDAKPPVEVDIDFDLAATRPMGEPSRPSLSPADEAVTL